MAKAALAFLPTARFVALRPPFPFWQAQFVQVFPLKPAPFCKLFAGLGSTRKSTIFLLFSDCLSLSPLLRLSSFLSLSGRNCPPVLSGCNGPPDTRFFWGTTRLMSWPDGVRCSCPLQFLVVSLFSYLSYPLFSFLVLEAYCLIEIF